MRTTVTLDDDLLAKAEKLTGVKERSTLLRMALESLIHFEASMKLAALGGSDADAEAPPRRRPK